MIEQTKMKFSKRTMALIALILIALFSILNHGALPDSKCNSATSF